MILEIGILEDSLSMAEQLEKTLNTWATNHRHIFHIHIFQKGEAIINSLSHLKYDVCFLDIRLDMTNPNAATGMDVAKQMRQMDYSGDLIFLTLFSEFVFEGYNVNAFHYILKPVDIETLHPVLSALINKHTNYYYFLKNRQEIEQIPYQQIITISSNLHDVIIMTADKNYTDRTPIREIEANLPPTFIRCHRSCIVNLHHITKINKTTIHLTNHLTQPIGRKYLTEVKKTYLSYFRKGFQLWLCQ